MSIPTSFTISSPHSTAPTPGNHKFTLYVCESVL